MVYIWGVRYYISLSYLMVSNVIRNVHMNVEQILCK